MQETCKFQRGMGVRTATHTVLMLSWPAQLGGRPGRSNSFVECASTPPVHPELIDVMC